MPCHSARAVTSGHTAEPGIDQIHQRIRQPDFANRNPPLRKQVVNAPLMTLSVHKRLPNPVTGEGGGILAYCQELLPLQHPRSFLPVGFRFNLLCQLLTRSLRLPIG